MKTLEEKIEKILLNYAEEIDPHGMDDGDIDKATKSIIKLFAQQKQDIMGEIMWKMPFAFMETDDQTVRIYKNAWKEFRENITRIQEETI